MIAWVRVVAAYRHQRLPVRVERVVVLVVVSKLQVARHHGGVPAEAGDGQGAIQRSVPHHVHDVQLEEKEAIEASEGSEGSEGSEVSEGSEGSEGSEVSEGSEGS